MIGLAIHTSSPELGLALTDFQGELRSQVWPLGRDLTGYLHTCLQEFIQPHTWQDLAFIAVAKGPGGFTGTRIGVVVARTLAQQLEIPLFGVSSLAAIAQNHVATQPLDTATPELIAVTLQAQRGELYGALYRQQDAQIVTVLEEAVYSPEAWEAQLLAQTAPIYRIDAGGGLAATVTGVLALALEQWQAGERPDWRSVLPFYGQHPVHS
jgi:tRNA threonylcarbamoyl adenosine modification protein YeaZ